MTLPPGKTKNNFESLLRQYTLSGKTQELIVAGRIRGLLEKLLGGRQSDTASESASDSELLRRFVVGSDQEAFDLLVWCHEVMVNSVAL
jgi:hypothetical protein